MDYQTVSPNLKATHAVSRTSSECIPLNLTQRVATELICVACSGLVLEKVCEYFYYNEKHKNSKDVPDIDVPAELCLELLMAADYLNGTFTLRAGESLNSARFADIFYEQSEYVRQGRGPLADLEGFAAF
jgi:hypothetical protein